ncbi:MAG: TolC family protein, partial [Nevskia sp.]
MSFFFFPSRFALAALPLLLAACATSTDYRAPEIALPASFQHAGTEPTAAVIQPDWWAVYADAELDRLLRRVGEANAELAQAEARWRQALAQVDAARALALPQIGAGASVTRSGGN